MIGFHYLSIKIETYIVSHYYNRDDMTIYEAIHFFMNNMFYSQRQKERILNNFCKIQRIRFLLLKYIKNFRIRKNSVNTEDLYMNPLENLKNESKLYISENKKIYIFYIPNIIQLWKKQLYHSNFMIIKPLSLKNPYTNTILSKKTLNYIYLKAYIGMYNIPIIVKQFFNCQFNKLNFIHEYGTMLQEKSIESYVNSCDIELYRDIEVIKNTYPRLTTNISLISNERYKITLINNMKPILMIYYNMVYSTNYVKKENSRTIFLYELSRYNDSLSIDSDEFSDTLSDYENELYFSDYSSEILSEF